MLSAAAGNRCASNVTAEIATFSAMPLDEIESVGDALITACTDPALDALAGLSETTLDAVLSDGVLRDLPIAGTLLALGRAGRAFRDQLLARKIFRFLREVGRTTTAADREKFKRKIEEDRSYRRRVAHTLVVILDRLDEEVKADLFARVYLALLAGKVDRVEFERLARAIDRVVLASDLAALSGWATEHVGKLPTAVGLSLQGAGLAEVCSIPTVPHPDAATDFQKTALGALMERAVLAEPVPED